MPETLIFYVLSGLVILASVLVIGQRNPMYSVMMLILAFAALAGLYIQLDAPFVAVAQIIIYAGAIMVLFLFVVMLLNAPQEDGAEWDRLHPLRRPGMVRFGALLALLLIAQLGWALASMRSLDAPVGSRTGAETVSSVRELGRVLFTDHMFAFEATSILILVAMVGAAVLARREGEEE
jgi:NADH-quinone oxidoreductase subunit J